MKIQRPVGTYDLTPEETSLWSDLETKIRSMFYTYNFGEIRTPIFEYTELFQRGVGESTDIVNKEMYTFTDRGERSITLRPEGTAAVVRAFIENGLEKKNPGVTKLWYFAPMFRYERKQKGRFRQHVQYGCEVFGSPGPDIDIELLVLLHRFYHSLGLTELNLKINSVGTAECRAKHKEIFMAFIKPKLDQFCEDCHTRFQTNPLRMFDCKNDTCQALLQDAPTLSNSLNDESKSHFAAVCEGLDALSVSYQVDPYLVRGLDYYTKTAFEMSYAPLGSQGVLVGGGRYDGLVEYLGGPSIPGIGFGAGMERLVLILQDTNKIPVVDQGLDLFIVAAGEREGREALHVLTALRQAGIRCDRDYTGKAFKKQFQMADKLKARYTLIIGSDEIAKKELVLKQMADGSQQTIPWTSSLEELIELVKHKV